MDASRAAFVGWSPLNGQQILKSPGKGECQLKALMKLRIHRYARCNRLHDAVLTTMCDKPSSGLKECGSWPLVQPDRNAGVESCLQDERGSFVAGSTLKASLSHKHLPY